MQYNFPNIFTINRYFIHRIVRIFWKCRWRRNWSWLNWISMDSINCWKTPSWGDDRDYWKFNLQDLMSLNKKVTKKKKPYKITFLCVCLCLPVDVRSLKIYKNNRLFYKVQRIYTWMYYFLQRIAHVRIKNLICTLCTFTKMATEVSHMYRRQHMYSHGWSAKNMYIRPMLRVYTYTF